MVQLNSVILEGVFLHFTSKKGSEKTTFILDNNGDGFSVVANGKLGEQVTKHAKRQTQMRIVGKLVKVGKSTALLAEYIEIKK